MIEEHSQQSGVKYDAILAIRPDTAQFKNKTDLPFHMDEIASLEGVNSIWVPDFQHWEGFNDRAAFGSVPV